MMKHVSRRIFLLSAFYVLIILGIMALQFRNGNAFQFSFGSVHVSGARDLNDAGAYVPVLPLHVGVNGLDFFLDDQTSVLAYISDNNSSPLKVTSFDQTPDSFRVRFQEGVSVTFSQERRGDVETLSVAADIPRKYQKITFPYKITRNARLEAKDKTVVVTMGSRQYSFSGAAAQEMALGRTNRLAITRSNPTVFYRTWLAPKGLVIEQLASLPLSSDGEWRRSTEKFASVALVSFRSAVAASAQNEQIAAAYVAEMGRVGMYRAALESLGETWRNSPSRTWLTNTFLNNLERTWAGFTVQEREERSRLARQLSAADPAVFEFPSLVSYLVDRGSVVLIDDIVKLASTVDVSVLTPLQAAGIIDAWIDSRIVAPQALASLEALIESCERILTASLVKIDDALYVSQEGETISTVDTFRIANILRRYGSVSSSKIHWKAAGNLLVNSLVTFSGDRSEYPARFSLLKGASGGFEGIVARSDQFLTPAVLYPLIMSENTWYPRALSLSASADPGVWVWTSAESVAIAKPANGVLRISTKFTQGETHYMVFRGIKPFYRIQIYGLDFRTDPRFESYNSSGYRYNEETETLYLKMRHKAEIEDITIWFGKDPAPAVQNEAESAPLEAVEAGVPEGQN